MQPWFLSVGDGLAILERAFSKPSCYCRLQRIIIRRVTLSGLAFIKGLALAGPVLIRGMTKRNRSGSHLVGPEQSVGREVSVPDQRLQAMSLSSLVDHANCLAEIIVLGQANGNKCRDGNEQLSKTRETHCC